MASVIMPGVFHIDYSIVDGRVRSFELNGQTLFDESNGVAIPGWKERLIHLVKEKRLDIDDGLGLHAFVKTLLKEIS